MTTLLLDQSSWDLVIDANGNIAMAAEPYSYAQDVATACRTFLGELWYDTDKGIPYNDDVLGHLPTADALRQYLVEAALTVDGVVKADATVASFDSRTITGNIVFVDIYGNTGNVGL